MVVIDRAALQQGVPDGFDVIPASAGYMGIAQVPGSHLYVALLCYNNKVCGAAGLTDLLQLHGQVNVLRAVW